jgi:hypothetical protein
MFASLVDTTEGQFVGFMDANAIAVAFAEPTGKAI